MDAISLLVDKAYPDLTNDAKDMLVLNKFLDKLADLRVVLAVRQLWPTTISEAVRASLNPSRR